MEMEVEEGVDGRKENHVPADVIVRQCLIITCAKALLALFKILFFKATSFFDAGLAHYLKECKLYSMGKECICFVIKPFLEILKEIYYRIYIVG